MSYVHSGNVISALTAQLQNLHPILSDAFLDTVDSRRLWDGTVQEKDFFRLTDHLYGNNGHAWQCFIPLTYGALSIMVNCRNSGEVTNIDFSYTIPPISSDWQPLHKNSIERQIWGKTCENASSTEKNFAKIIRDKVKSLVKAVNEWWGDAGATKFVTVGSSFQYDNTMKRLVSAIGKVRLASQMHVDAMNFHKSRSNAMEINELANKMLELIEEQRKFNPAFGIKLSEVFYW